jgi:Cu(I)/Ag(I) efflux system membrane fusion protein
MHRKTYIFILAAFLLGGILSYFVFTEGEKETTKAEHKHSSAEETTIYTCSMHPSVEQDEPGKCPICEMDLVPKSSTSSDDPLVLEMSADAVRLSQLELAEVESADDEGGQVLALNGLLKEDEDYSSRIVSYLPGELVRLYVKSEGERVQKGQLLAEIYAPELRIHQEELIEAAENRLSNPELYRAVRKKLDYWKIDSSFLEKILIEKNARDILPIHATATGTVRELMIGEGEILRRGQALARVANLNYLWAEFTIPESELDLVSRGSRVRFSPISSPGQQYTGSINYIDPTIDPEKRTAVARASISSRGKLKPEMTIKGYLSQPNSAESTVLKVPSEAVLWTGPRSVVYVEVPDATVPSYSYREVQLERMGREYAYISEGLELGERVVSNGAFIVDAAAQLNNQKSMMNRMVEGSSLSAGNQLTLNPFHQEAVSKTLESYFSLKDALVQSDSLTSQKIAEKLSQQLRSIPPTLEDPDRRKKWAVHQSKATDAADQISKTNQLKEQRKAFADVSNAFIYWFRHFNIKYEAVYMQYCPMAFDFSGANWISKQEEIRNPYFGDEMLKCGTVEEVFQ